MPLACERSALTDDDRCRLPAICGDRLLRARAEWNRSGLQARVALASGSGRRPPRRCVRRAPRGARWGPLSSSTPLAGGGGDGSRSRRIWWQTRHGSGNGVPPSAHRIDDSRSVPRRRGRPSPAQSRGGSGTSGLLALSWPAGRSPPAPASERSSAPAPSPRRAGRSRPSAAAPPLRIGIAGPYRRIAAVAAFTSSSRRAWPRPAPPARG